VARAANKPIRTNARTSPKPVSRATKATEADKEATSAGDSVPIDLYFWPTPNGWKITIMLEECGLQYTVIPVDISKGEQFKPEFLAISPNN
jgi:hypothetical protein